MQSSKLNTNKKRVLTIETKELIGQEVILKGWVERVRSHGKLVFFDLRDRKGILQVVVNQKTSQKTYETAANLKPEDVITLIGIVNKRPENATNKEIETGIVELEAKDIKIISKSQVLPFDIMKKSLDLELPTLLDFRALTLRHSTQKNIFAVQAQIADAFRQAAKKLDCIEIFVPTIAASATEGGAEVFPIDYYGHNAYLTQSPQLYKQIMVGVFERVYTIAHAYRAEPSTTIRHISESTQMDCEIGFVEDFNELLDYLEFVGTHTVREVAEECSKILDFYGAEAPLIPNNVPRLTLRQVQEVIYEKTGRDVRREKDLSPEDEKDIWLWAREEHKSDFVTITHFPTRKRAFYTMPDMQNSEYSLSFDLIFKGMEISSGSQRINDYEQLVYAIKDRGLNPESFGIYLQAFKYGIPPEGGFSYGLERITMKLLNLANIREASLFPRDMERVDERFSVMEKTQK